MHHKDKLVEALQKDKSGDWDGAQRIVQRFDTLEANWIHAYLHREEGDYSNSRYWYSRVGKPFPTVSLEEEWNTLLALVNAG